MGLIEVDIVGAEATQRAVDRLLDVFARQAVVVLTGLPYGEEDLGEDLQALTSLALQRLPEEGLGFGSCVGVGGVERGDADIERLSHTRERLILFDLRPVRQPV